MNASKKERENFCGLNLGMRAYNGIWLVLDALNIEVEKVKATWGPYDVLQYVTPQRLRAVRAIGEKTIIEIDEAFRRVGINPDWPIRNGGARYRVNLKPVPKRFLDSDTRAVLDKLVADLI